MKALSPYHRETFAEEYPKFRLLTIICIGYWTLMLILLFSRKDLEFGDTFSFLMYSTFAVMHLFLFSATYISDKFQRGQKLIFNMAIAPFILSMIAMMISIFSYSSLLFEKIFE